MVKTLLGLFETNIDRFGTSPALLFKQQELSYAELGTEVVRLRSYLLREGMQKGDRVALILDKEPAFVISYLAITTGGGVAVPLNYKLSLEELRHPILSGSRPRFLIAGQKFSAKAQALCRETDSIRRAIIDVALPPPGFVTWTEALSPRGEVPVPRIDPGDMAAISYTSGTTNNPKGVTWTHQAILAHVQAISSCYNITQNDRWAILLPSFLSAHNSVILPFFSGVASVLLPNNNPAKILHHVNTHNITTMMCAAVVCLAILNLTKASEDHAESLRLVVPGGMHFPADKLREFEQRFDTQVLDVLAMTELGIYLSNRDGDQQAGAVGVPIPGMEVLVVDEAGLQVPRGTTGEIIARGRSTFCGYYHAGGLDRSAIDSEGWMKTGDLGYQGANGFFYHVSRKGEMINVGGLKVFPAEVEEVIATCEKVREVAITPSADRHRGQIPKAWIVLKENASCSSGELRRFCRGKLAQYKVPRIFEFIDRLPRNGSGKVLKRNLIDWREQARIEERGKIVV